MSLTNTDPRKTDLFAKFDWPRVSCPCIDFSLPQSNHEADVIEREQKSEREIRDLAKWLQLELVQPKFICCLGTSAAQNLLNTTRPLGQLRGKFHDYRGIPVLCTYHPAYLLRNPGAKKDVWEDLKKLLARMGRPVPPSPAASR